MATAVVIGSTGLVGSKILTTLLPHPKFQNITSITRRAPKAESSNAKLNAIIESDSTKWSSSISSISPAPQIYFSALGTTRAAAGGVENQRKIDYDLNLEMATAARKAGSKVCVLISSGSASAESRFAYTKMKGELEEQVKELGFEHTVIVRPGLILGDREEKRTAEGIARGVAGFLGGITTGLVDGWAQSDVVIARAGVAAGLKALEGEIKEKVVVLAQADVVRLGRTEWKD